ncbi:MAG: late competence development ComFB family protein [PVC group bacterium]|nr:late competence development ComFB family protein [PVC group bacterium]
MACEIKNYLEFVVDEAVDNFFKSTKDICKCEQCKLDITALVLNRMPARYIVTAKGRIMTKLKETEIQFQVDVLREIIIAAEIVRKNPRHTNG